MYPVKYIPFYQCVLLHEFAGHTPASDKAKEMCPDSGCLYATTAVLLAGVVLYDNIAES